MYHVINYNITITFRPESEQREPEAAPARKLGDAEQTERQEIVISAPARKRHGPFCRTRRFLRALFRRQVT